MKYFKLLIISIFVCVIILLVTKRGNILACDSSHFLLETMGSSDG